MKVLPRREVGKSLWDAFCDSSPDTWLHHRFDWCEIERTFFTPDEHSCAIVESGEILGLVPLYLRQNGLGAWTERVLDSGCHRHTGVAAAGPLTGNRRRAVRRALVDHLISLAASLAVDRIQLNAHNLARARWSPRWEDVPFWTVEYGFEPGLNFGPLGMVPVPGMSTCCADQVVVLEARTEEDLFASLEESCRRAVRKALRAGFSLEELKGDGAVDEYYRLAIMSSQRTGESLPSIEYYRAMFHAFSDSGRCSILFARKDAVRAGALFLLSDQESTTFLAGVSSEEFLHLRVNDWLHWQAICWARGKGHRAYRLGPIFPALPSDWPTARVSRFKGKWGGASFAIVQGSLFRRPSRYRDDGLREIDRRCLETEPGAPEVEPAGSPS